ncbi:CAP domain-containing protein [Streptomyces albireticuli]|uniref:CAP domain-containing protein n=1 Tax=Streptomyces albireticuli TaxID=1940 RepID=UPI00368574BB
MRTGLLGASAAMAMGVVAVASGLFSGGDALQLGSGPGGPGGGQVRTDEPAALETGAEPPVVPAPGRGRLPVGQGVERPHGHTAPVARFDTPAPADSGAPARPAADPSAPAPPDEAHGPPSPVAAATPAVAYGSTGARHPEPAADTLRAGPVAQILDLVNEERAKAGLNPLVASHRLTVLAQSFSDDMARRGFFSHTDPDGRTPWDRAAKRGIGNLGGENIARGHPDPRAVMEAWMRSTGHRANILNRTYRTLGIGVNLTGTNGPWWTQDFGY